MSDILELKQTASMLDTYAKDLFPDVNEKGQVHFGRGIMEAAAETIRAYLEKIPNEVFDLAASANLASEVKAILEDEKFGDDQNKKDAEALDVLLTPRHVDEWHEDMGDVIWWNDPINEPPYIGSPLHVGGLGRWPGYHQWFTPLPTNDHIGLIQKRIEVAKAKTLTPKQVEK